MYRATIDGWKLGLGLRSKYGVLELSKAPHIRVPNHVIITHAFFPIRSTFLRNRFIVHSDLVFGV
ncbi:hypothetical protein [Vulcanisaeta distributa]|uniref:hypothetical protein n=1 Tax=Vulcanisaeta distributa TaxID=164451 RepID=UPI0006D2A983|nr:hypothetical protein [Vulcanisaeta distributa]